MPERFLELRSRARQSRIGDGGPALCAELTAALDDVAVDLAGAAPDDAPFALVALGGYGRGEQCLFSDVDLMLLQEEGDVDATAAAVFRPLWDAGLKVGHSVRTPADAAAGARQRLDTLTSLLSARLVAGDRDLFAAMQTQLTGVVQGKPLAPALAAAERQRRQRHPYPVMAADLKEGRGALRTFQGLEWERRRAALLGIAAPPMDDDEEEAFAALLAIRNALHAVTGRAHDVFTTELREPVARWMGRNPRVVAGLLMRALHAGDRLAERSWPDLLAAPDDPLASFRKRLVGTIRSRFSSTDATLATGTPLPLAVGAAERQGQVRFTTDEQDRINAAPETWTSADRNAFVRLIAGGERARAAFELLDELGWTQRSFPEYVLVRAAPQMAPFHEHPVDTHLWRTVDEMRRIVEGNEDLLRSIADELGSTEELFLARRYCFNKIQNVHAGNFRYKQLTTTHIFQT